MRKAQLLCLLTSSLLALALASCGRDSPHARVALTQADCVQCHRAEYDATTSPSHILGDFPTTCGDCHSTETWENSVKPPNHDMFTGDMCVDCHRADYAQSPYPGHNNFPTTCLDCHSRESFKPSTFDHSNYWPHRTGAHVGVPCVSCHTRAQEDPPVYSGTPTECSDCHSADYQRAASSTRVEAHDTFPMTCLDCHTTDHWFGADWTHPWPLLGAHGWTPCASCHEGAHDAPPTFTGESTVCVDCHRADYERSTAPGHHTFPTDCTMCHGNTTWAPSFFVHDWPLTGSHIGVRCENCHVNATQTPPDYTNTPSECDGCHHDDYLSSPYPGHEAFPTTCADCHQTTTWKTGSFTHPWPLTGAHGTTPCSSCHVGTPPVYAGIPQECDGCHHDDYLRSTHPGHQLYPLTCESCHATAAWRPSTFDHDTFPLLGAHGRTGCANCHGDPPIFAGTPRDCYSCHDGDFASSTYPQHQLFPHDCTQCHGNESWKPASFVHSFPLTGGHFGVACASCHGNPPTYLGTPSDCVSCHQDDFTRATMTVDSHSTYDPAMCTTCHTNVGWRPSVFNHPWPLIGVHATTECTNCHTGSPPRYQGTPMNCVDCHATDRPRGDAAFPGHSSFPNTCGDCHTSFTWQGASFDHPWPLVGVHATTACANCHTGSPPRYAGTPMDCQSCHAADFASSQYAAHSSFSPAMCASCHTPTGWTPAQRGYHLSSPFPIASGRHSGIACNRCHDTSVANNVWFCGRNANCIQCHSISGYAGEHRGVSGYPSAANASPDTCYQCHASGSSSRRNPPACTVP